MMPELNSRPLQPARLGARLGIDSTIPPAVRTEASQGLPGPSALRLLQRIGALLSVVSALLCLPNLAMATCSFNGGTGPSNVTFNPPTTITVPYTAPVGTVLYTSPQVSPAPTATISCTGTSNYGITNSGAATPAAGINIYPTSIPGLSYMLAHGNATSYMFPYPCCQIGAGNYTFSVTTSLVLVKTGPIVSGSTLPTGPLGYWRFDNNQQPEIFTLGNSVTIVDPACSVNTTPLNVTLPSISTSALQAVGATAGTTGFVIALTCYSGATLDIQFDYSGANSGITGVLTKTAGSSSGVGVQMLDQSLNPITFGTATLVGGTVSPQMNLTYYARYYRTAAISAGTLTASATFTLSYQ